MENVLVCPFEFVVFFNVLYLLSEGRLNETEAILIEQCPGPSSGFEHNLAFTAKVILLRCYFYVACKCNAIFLRMPRRTRSIIDF